MIRFVLDPKGNVVPDLKAKLPGRGVWIAARAHYVRAAVDNNLFSRAFKAPAHCLEDLADIVGSLLEKRCLEYLSLARKAGLASLGHAKVKAALGAGAAVLIAARDGAEQGKRKLATSANADVVHVECLGTGQLSLAFGRSNVVHAALRRHRLTEEFLLAANRMKDYIDERA